MIKPEDVPESLVHDVYAQMKKCIELDELGTPVSTEQQIAELLSLCIEAGVVSPPCSCYGETLRPMLGVRFLFLGKPQHVWQEHWKGQL